MYYMEDIKKTGMALRVVGYARVSSEEQAETGLSLDCQRAKLLAYAELYGIDLVEVIEDPGISAKDLNRPGVRRVLEMFDSGQIDGVLVVKLDRLSRSVGDMSRLIDKYFSERGGKALLSVNDSLDTRTASGRLVINVLMSVSEWERSIVGERTREILRYKRARGEVYSGTAPYGFDRDGDRLVPSKDDAETIARAKSLSHAGKSIRQIVDILEGEGHRPKKGGRWHPGTVSRLLKRAA